MIIDDFNCNQECYTNIPQTQHEKQLTPCTALLQQELQNLYWCLHDPITTKSYQISSEMDIETMPHAMYFSGSIETVTKINHVPYQTIEYDDKGMFQAKING